MHYQKLTLNGFIFIHSTHWVILRIKSKQRVQRCVKRTAPLLSAAKHLHVCLFTTLFLSVAIHVQLYYVLLRSYLLQFMLACVLSETKQRIVYFYLKK